MNILLICLGGSLGALSRFYLSNFFQKSENPEIPLGILTVNILGCFLIGLFYNLVNSDLERILTPFLFVGFLGAFTTFSAFSKESLELINSGNFFIAFIYILISIISCLGATWLGMFLTRS
jgi:CrcB protein|tara:strand:+ start:57 stop:419 length:363 start_codon:yes stop_codon:yes gene_type:complete